MRILFREFKYSNWLKRNVFIFIFLFQLHFLEKLESKSDFRFEIFDQKEKNGFRGKCSENLGLSIEISV